MPSEDEILNALRRVKDPELQRNIVELGMVKNIAIKDGEANLTIALTVPSCPLSGTIEKNIKETLEDVGVKVGSIQFTSMTKDEREALSQRFGRRMTFQKMEKGGIAHVIAVTSGKGGVGKSALTALLAVDLQRQGYDVGILDSDVTGPSIAKMFGVTRLGVGEHGITPAISKLGIKIMSMHLLMKKPDEPAIWRGPLLNKVITQMYQDVEWGKLDYLFIDVPPGTSDVPLTLYQTFPLDGIVVVATPQDLVALIVRKAVNMALQMKIPILGLMENMSYLLCPHCHERIEPWGPMRGEKIAKEMSIPYLGALPMDLIITSLTDTGNIENYENTVLKEISRRLIVSQMSATKAQLIDWTLSRK